MAENYLDKFKRLLAELFMFDQADLDFGIYRIMNAKRDEITRFLDNDLLPQVRSAIGELEQADRAALQTDLAKAIEQAKGVGVDPESAPRVRELRQAIAKTADIEALEAEVFSDLYNFFRRYYDDGDFLSLRRYKEGVYAIPYQGEELKFHWANYDQYYIKTAEYFRDYTFTVGNGRRVHFRLADADSEQDNNRTPNGRERRFILREADPVGEENGELVIRFEYRPDGGKRKQTDLNAQATRRIFEAEAARNWLADIAAKAPTDKNPDRTVLEKRLADYTARNTFDYFIHKDLAGFLRRELDFYIKNEIVHLDDIESDVAPRVEQYLAKVKAIRQISHKVIDFLAQIENFEKKVWLKKKFVVETNYCITLDRIPEDLYPEIAASVPQRDEWVALFAIDEIKGDLIVPAYSVPLTVEFLKAHNTLAVDTRFFDSQFKDRLLASIQELDEHIDGVLVHSDNFQALRLMEARYRQQVKCIYIDPPYNTDSSSIPYKNDYRHSSWATMMRDRLAELRSTMTPDAAIFVSIDKTERTVLEHALDEIFGHGNRVEELIWAMNTTNSQAPNYSTNHEYVEVYARDRRIAEQDPTMFREPKPGFEEVMELVARLNPQYPAIKEIEGEIQNLYERHRIEYREAVEAQGLEWEDEKGNDPWRGLFNYSKAEYRDASGAFASEGEAKERTAKIWVFQEGDASMPATKQAETTRDPNHPNWRFYKPPHPETGRPCPHPKSGWKFAYDDDADSPEKRSFVSLDRDHRIAWGKDENKVPRIKRMLHEVETNIGKSVFQDYSDGEKQTSAMFGRSGIFLAPKHADFVSRFILHSAKPNSTILDCFGGTGSTGHAVVKLNRGDRGHRKYVLVEVGSYFDTILKPRVLKAAYSSDWKAGKPVDRKGVSHCVKVIRLESYEDALNNVELQRTQTQADLLGRAAGLREDYVLRYMLDVESSGSSSLLNTVRFDDPLNYTLSIGNGSVGETRKRTVDLIETFNWLLGLRVKHIDTIRGFRVVEGTMARGERALVIWRNTGEKANSDLDDFFLKQGYNTRDMEFDVIYVNGDNNLENLKRPDDTWKVRLIEEDFKKLMFDVQDV
ncbi:MAG TPA: DNA methyltransferase [Terriglobales bacterium]|jgi:adenine-specific DNA-methyltransferase|nr:DNA methyltransferase [Terriglobales bacterium]